MRPPTLFQKRSEARPRTGSRSGAWPGGAAVALAAAVLACAACTLLVDRTSTQCQSDGDCAKFGAHPFCQGGVCVASGLGPAACFYGTPSQPSDFLNQCSAAQCLSFDDCARLHVCSDAGADGGEALVPPPAIDSGAATPASADGGAAAALPSCLDPTSGRGTVIFITGSSNFPPLLAKLAPLILAQTGYVPVYQVSSSCQGVLSVFSAAPSDQTIVDPPPGPGAKYAAYFNADGSSTNCTLGPSGATVDIGESDIFSTTCGSPAPGEDVGVGEYLGPIQSMAFVVPGESQQTALSAEAARDVFGRGGDNGSATPWTDPSLYFVRNASTGTQQMIGRAIGVPAEAFWGVNRGSAANVDQGLRVISDPAQAEQAIGIISTDYYDSDRVNLKALAFKAAGQDCAYLPDSTEFKTDKRNVRDGHYPIWGPLHFFAAVSDALPVSPAAHAFVSVLSVPNIAPDLLDAFIAASLVPECAMSVTRSTELGPLSSFSPPLRCDCYFEASPTVNGAPAAECTRCSTGNDCTDPTRPACNLGYCEPQ